ncbi:MAG: S8 family serine peptidase [bacterium]|nr:S8 family serine peptidase [bacterium]
MSRRFVVCTVLVCCIGFFLCVIPSLADEPAVDLASGDEIERPLYARDTYVWPFDRGPHYGSGDRLARRRPGVVNTGVGSFDLKRGTPSFPIELSDFSTLDGVTPKYFFVMLDPAQIDAAVLDEIRAALTGAGGALGAPAPYSGYLARLNRAAFELLQARADVLAVERYHPAYKLSPLIGRTPLYDRQAASSDVYELELRLFDGESAADVERLLTGLQVEVRAVSPDTIRVRAHRSRLPDLAKLEPVRQISEHVPVHPLGDESSATIQTGMFMSGATPYRNAGVDGGGSGIAPVQKLMIIDNGIQLDAGDLSDTRTSAGTPSPSHRKVCAYETTAQFGGNGDLLGCDSSIHGGYTHGHMVASIALGHAGDTGGAYGGAWPPIGNRRADGVAPGAQLVAYDAYDNGSTSASCIDPLQNGLSPGDLYAGFPGSGALGKAYSISGARTFNLSWGAPVNAYTANSFDIDRFLDDHDDAMLFCAVGNSASLGAGSVSTPATAKNSISVGASFTNSPVGVMGHERRWPHTSLGPATASGRVAPLLMAPGADRAGPGSEESLSCVTPSDAQNDPVSCSALAQDKSGSSFAAAAASGAAMVVRDYFAQGFYPDGTSSNAGNAADIVPNISGALNKALLVASADFMNDPQNKTQPGANLTQAYRFNHEQGYGRIQLSHVLPLKSWSWSPAGLIVHDAGIAGGVSDLPGLSAGLNALTGQVDTTFFEVCDPTQELRVALSWVEQDNDFLINDLDLELVSPSGLVYQGNYFTEDENRDTIFNPFNEDCGGTGSPFPNGVLDESQWSLVTCTKPNGQQPGRDSTNTTEAIFLSPDPDFDPNTSNSQIEQGTWMLRVTAQPGGSTASQKYAVAVAGGACINSNIVISSEYLSCNDDFEITVTEFPTGPDPGPWSTAQISGRVKIEVIDPAFPIPPKDVEDSFTFVVDGINRWVTQPKLSLVENATPTSGNTIIEVQHGWIVRAVYTDPTGGGIFIDTNATAEVHCRPQLEYGDLKIPQFGLDRHWQIIGGCERDPLGGVTHGFPDRYIDAGEKVIFRTQFRNADVDLTDVRIGLRAVIPDANSELGCLPDTACDYERLTNLPSPHLTVLTSPVNYGPVPSGAIVDVGFAVQAAALIPGTPEVELVVEVTANASGKTVKAILPSRHTCDVDEFTCFYSTDYPTGGTEIRDYDSDGTTVGDDPNPQTWLYETTVYCDATATGKNFGLQSPWNFDSGPQGFTSGIGAITDEATIFDTIAQWGEDKNFNNLLDPTEDRDPVNGVLDQSWSTDGGCGWQTAAGPTGGAWHTGRIGTTAPASCLVQGNSPGQCQAYETISGSGGGRRWLDLLITPPIEKVSSTAEVEIVNFAWNMSVDLGDEHAVLTWEVDNRLGTPGGVDLIADDDFLGSVAGPLGSVSGGNYLPFGGYPLFAPLDASGQSTNLTRVGDNACFFEGPGQPLFAPLELVEPIDGTGLQTPSGPIRNMDITKAGGPDLHDVLLEDLIGESGDTFQAALGLLVKEKDLPTLPDPVSSLGATIDDVVVEWREYELVDDQTSCNCACATVHVDTSTIFAPAALLSITVIEDTPTFPTDCNDNQVVDGADSDNCDADPFQDIVARVYSDGEPDGEPVLLNRTTAGSPLFRGAIPVSTRQDVDGTLFVDLDGNRGGDIRIVYEDQDDGSGNPCPNTVDPGWHGFIEASAELIAPSNRLLVVDTRVVDVNGDVDSYADQRETADLYVTVRNKSGFALNNVVARLTRRNDNIACVTQGLVSIGNMADGEIVETPTPFTFIVDEVARTDVHDLLTGDFSITFSSDQTEWTAEAQQFELDLDLDVAGGSGPANFIEEFEAPGLAGFSPMSLDTGLATNALSNGLRCQYNDPALMGSNSFGDAFCYLGFANPADNGFDWHRHDTTQFDGGRASQGVGSLHFGVHLAPGDDTTRLSQLDAVQLTDPVNLGWNATDPELSFKQQISLVDSRAMPIPGGETLDRAVVQVQRADAAGDPVGDWETIRPFYNAYDSQPTDESAQCAFDPVDDGNDEDNFFSTREHHRRLGPSSTCYSEPVFAHQGDASNDPFDPTAIGRACDGPGIAGSIGPGTWVETRFSLGRYRGSRIRIRFLVSTSKFADLVTYRDLGFPSTERADDGWYIDDVQITDTLTTPAFLAVDVNNNAALPTCGAACLFVSPSLTATPAALAGPGSTTLLSAAGSSATSCHDGVLQYRFWIDGDGNGTLDQSDSIIRDWLDVAEIEPVVQANTDFAVDVRCSSDPSCNNTSFVSVTVPSLSGTPGEVENLEVIERNPSTGELSITYDVPCEGTDHTLHYGDQANAASYTFSGEICSIGNSGAFGPFNLPPGSYFFIVVANDGATTEGSYGKDSFGVEIPPHPTCGFTQDLPNRCD